MAEPRGLGALRKRGAFDALATPAVVAAIGELLGHERAGHARSAGETRW